MAALITEAKPRQLQVTRIRQEEEESWISSEELYTDGSSDDESGRWGVKHVHHHHLLHHIPPPLPHRLPLSSPLATSGPLSSPPPPSTASEPASQDSPHLTETTRRLSELGVEGVPLLLGSSPISPNAQEDCVEEQEDIMLWRPKRGSLKLTELATGAITLSSSASSAGKLLSHKDAATSSSTDIAEEKGPCAANAAAQCPSPGAISKCSSVSGATAKNKAPLPPAGHVETKDPKESIAEQTVSLSAAKEKVEVTTPGDAAQICVKSCSSTPRASAAVPAKEKSSDSMNKEISVKDTVADAKINESIT